MTPIEKRQEDTFTIQLDIDKIENIDDIRKVLTEMMKYIDHLYEIAKEK